MYSIGKFARKTGISIRTLRYYGEKGLLQPIFVSDGGQRYYSDESIITLQKITTFKYLDYTLEEIRELIAGNGSLLESLQQQKEQLLLKRKQLDQMLASLDTAILIHEKSPVIDPTSLLLVMHSILTEEQQKEFLQQFLPESVIQRMYTYLDDNFVNLSRQYIEYTHNIKEAFHHGVNDQVLKRTIEQLFALIPIDIVKEIAVEFEKSEVNQLDMWLFPSLFSKEEEAWLIEQAERFAIFEGETYE